MSVHSLFEQLVPRVVGFVCVWAETCSFGILKSGQTGRMFSLFSRIGYNGLPEYFGFLFTLG